MSEALLLTVVGIVGGIVGSIVQSALSWMRERRKSDAEAMEHEAGAAGAISDASLKLIEPLSRRVDDLEAQARNQQRLLDQQAEQIATVTAERDALRAEVEELRPLRGEVAALRLEVERLRDQGCPLASGCPERERVDQVEVDERG